MAVLEEHNSCLEEGKRSTESSLPLLGVEDTHMWEPRSGHGAPLDGEPLLEEYSLPFLSQSLMLVEADHQVPWQDCGLWEEGDKILRVEHIFDPETPFWVANILLQEVYKRLVDVPLPPRQDDRREEEADKPCLEACMPHLFCG